MSKVVVLHPLDNVATAVSDLAPGDLIRVDARDVHVAEAVPFGHKLALFDIPAGASVLKYGEAIGLASRDIRMGGYVHIHNVESQRGRGDLTGDAK